MIWNCGKALLCTLQSLTVQRIAAWGNFVNGVDRNVSAHKTRPLKFEGGFVTRRIKEKNNDKMGEKEKNEEIRRIYQLMAFNMAVDDMDGKMDR